MLRICKMKATAISMMSSRHTINSYTTHSLHLVQTCTQTLKLMNSSRLSKSQEAHIRISIDISGNSSGKTISKNTILE